MAHTHGRQQGNNDSVSNRHYTKNDFQLGFFLESMYFCWTGLNLAGLAPKKHQILLLQEYEYIFCQDLWIHPKQLRWFSGAHPFGGARTTFTASVGQRNSAFLSEGQGWWLRDQKWDAKKTIAI